VQGPEAVQKRQASEYNMVISILGRLALIASFSYYLSRCLKIYLRYKKWSLNQFSNTELIAFNWFRNFTYAMIFWLLFREVMNVLDTFLELDFYQDWWWNLALVAVSVYIGLAGYAQKQPPKIYFDENKTDNGAGHDLPPREDGKSKIAVRLHKVMQEERLYLQGELNLQELAQHLSTTPALLSATINQQFGQNFNDFINSLRVEAFIKRYQDGDNERYTLLSLALDAGFNSKATFNRAFKKLKGCSPKEYFSRQT
jgi:AraC-like DNA-binding protein